VPNLIGNIYKYYVYVQSHLFVLNDFEKARKSGVKDWLGGEGVNTFWKAMIRGSDFELSQESQDS
jgi:hypothetical protein